MPTVSSFSQHKNLNLVTHNLQMQHSCSSHQWNQAVHLPASCSCRRDNGLPFEETLLYLRMESGDPTVLGSRWDNSLYVAAGKDPFILIEKAVAAAAQLSGGAQQRQDKRQPDSLNWFGWCTWDAYYSKVSARGKRLYRAAHLNGQKLPPRYIVFACMIVRLY